MREDNHMSEFIRDKEGIGWRSEVKYPAAEQRGMTKLLFSKSAPRGGVLDPRAVAKCKQACVWLVAYARINAVALLYSISYIDFRCNKW